MKIRYILGLVIALFLSWFFFHGVNFHQLSTAIVSSNLNLLLISLGLNLSTYYLRSARWKLILTPIKEISIFTCFKITAVGFMMNNIIPRSGDVVRPVLIGKIENIPISSSLATIVMERILDFLFLFLILGILLVFLSSSFQERIDILNQYIVQAGLFILIFSITMIGLLAGFVFRSDTSIKILMFVLRPLPTRIKSRVEEFIQRFKKGLDIIRNPKQLTIIALISFITWELLALQTLVTIYAFESYLCSMVPLFKNFLISNLVLVTATLAFIIPTPGGLGSFHLVFAKTLQMFGEMPLTAKGIALVVHFLSIIPITITGLYFMVTSNYTQLSKKAISRISNKCNVS